MVGLHHEVQALRLERVGDVVPLELARRDRADEPARAFERFEAQVLWPHGEHHGARGGRLERHFAQEGVRHRAAGVAGDQVGAAQEAGDEGGARSGVDAFGRAVLLDASVAHHDQPVGEGHRFLLVVRDQEGRGPDALEDLAHLEPGALPQGGVQAGEGFVQQDQLRARRECSGQGHALLLAAGELVRQAVLEEGQAHEAQHLPGPFEPFLAGQGPEAEGGVLEHAQVREQRVVLEHEAHAPRLRRHVHAGSRERAALERHRARVQAFEPGDEAQGGGLAAPGRPQQRHDAARVQVEADAVHRGRARRVKALREPLHLEQLHGVPSRPAPSRPSTKAANTLPAITTASAYGAASANLTSEV